MQVLIFAGTQEGRTLAQTLSCQAIETTVCVATAYASSLFEKNPSLTVLAQRLDVDQMIALMQTSAPDVVVDATHPYATVVTAQVKQAAAQCGVEYLRLLRPSKDVQGTSMVIVADIEQAVNHLKTTTGGIFVTTGSKQLSALTALPAYQTRVYARVLPLPSVMESVFSLGLQGKQIIAMQGPFSYESNLAMFQQTGARILLTKESGDVGGLLEKLEAADALGMQVVLIGRPLTETGLSLQTVTATLCARYGIAPQIQIVGIGMGNPNTLTKEATDAIEKADLLVGASRMVDAVKQPYHQVHCAYQAEEIASYLQAHPQYQRVAILQSGDVGFYSGCKKLLPLLPENTTLIAGISSPIYFCAKLKIAWQDVKMTSLHGMQDPVIDAVQQYQKVFVLLAKSDDLSQLSQQLLQYQLDHVTIHVGERLSYDDERITSANPSNFVDYSTHPLSVLLIENHKATPHQLGLCDDAFLRDQVPMTKSEIRTLSIAKLQLTAQSVVWDIGAGTGSVAIEMARVAHQGAVIAIEKNDKALALLAQNKQRFATDHLQILRGTAPAVLQPLDPPTHAFIGGSSGNLQDIVALLLQKNNAVRVVINAITLETVAQAMDVIKTLPVCAVDVVCVTVARSESIGQYHLMRGQNPVYIISFTGRGC